MEPLTIDTLRTLSRAHGLSLDDEELGRMLPLVEAVRATMAAVPADRLQDIEPAAQYRML